MQLGLIGAGNMAHALARGWNEPILCSDGGSGRARELVAEVGGEALSSNREVAERADLVLLCHKPYQLNQVAGEIAGTARAVVSVLGGVRSSQLEQAFPGTPVFTMQPNTPVAVCRGVTIYAEPRVGAGHPPADPELESKVLELFGRLGRVVRLPEALADVASALTAVGPAYEALLAEAQVDAGVRRGVPAALASELVVETMSGTAALLAERGYDTLAIRREVTSPGGVTARGLAVLEKAGIRGAFHSAIDSVVP
jgi:pyrroline-5-carboxylate reductase